MIVIPARMASTRFPGKPLCDLLGKPMIQWVYEAAVASGVAGRVIIATPDDEIITACSGFGAESFLTSISHLSGTDRIAEVAKTIEADFYVNVQGDEPLVSPATIAACARAMKPNVEMASIYSFCKPEEIENPAVVKVVTDIHGKALYFSRYPIPYPRSERLEPVKKHVGLYAYTRDVVLRFSTWKPGVLEQAESLEQLRFMENGVSIYMAEGEATAISVDTPEQAEEARMLLHTRS